MYDQVEEDMVADDREDLAEQDQMTGAGDGQELRESLNDAE